MIFLSLILLFLILNFYHLYWKRRSFPPGPTPLPLIGNLHSLYYIEAFKKWEKNYGPIYTIWLGEYPIVLISDFDLIMETVQKDGESFTGRNFEFSDHMRGGNYGVICSNGDLWKEQRQFTINTLRQFGVGKNIMQEKILLDVEALISNIKDDIDSGIKEIDVLQHIESSVGSVINSILFGYRFTGDHVKEFRELKSLMNEFILMLAHPLAILLWKYLPIANYIPIMRYYYNRFWYQQNKLFDFFRRQIEEHKIRMSKVSDEPNDYVGMFLREMEMKEKESIEHFYTMPQLVNMCFDLWMSGQETTTNTISWGVIYILLAVDSQAKLHEELDRVIGSKRMIVMEDRPRLPYTCAVINEIQRLANIFFFILKTTTRDCWIRDFKIKKGTAVVPMIYMVLNDEKIFPEPDQFRPERFLDENGKLKKVEELIPYSVGKRKCIGESMANMELFLFITNLFNNFKITAVPDKPPSLIKRPGATLSPHPFECLIEKRD